MKVYGDIERVNLHTGERWVRVSGDGESRLERMGQRTATKDYVCTCGHNRMEHTQGTFIFLGCSVQECDCIRFVCRDEESEKDR